MPAPGNAEILAALGQLTERLAALEQMQHQLLTLLTPAAVLPA